jgi:hypothetical protein
MIKSQNGSRNPSHDIYKNKTRNLTEPTLSGKTQLTSMKKSSKQVLMKGTVPSIKIVSNNVSISNYISSNTTNNITVNITNTPELKSERLIRKNISIFNDPFKTKTTYLKSRRNKNSISNSLTQESKFCKTDRTITLTEINTDESAKFSLLDMQKKKPKGVLNKARVTNELIDDNLEKMIHKYTIDRFKTVTNETNPDLSIYFINDEKNDGLNVTDSKEYAFIGKIKNEIKFKLFNTRAFLELTDDAMYNILSYSYPFYDKLLQTNRVIKRKIHITLNNKFNHIIQMFRNLYSEYIELQEYFFRPKYMTRNNKQCKIN